MIRVVSYVAMYAVLLSVILGSWATHVINCIKDEQWFLLLIGVLVAPVGMIHGVGIWIGLFQ